MLQKNPLAVQPAVDPVGRRIVGGDDDFLGVGGLGKGRKRKDETTAERD